MLRMKRHLFLSIIALLLAASVAQGQVGRLGEHVLFGDFRIEGVETKDKSATFYLALYTRTGQFVSRQAITNGGRYRFFNVANGEYSIAVELNGTEVARVSMLIQEMRKTDVRQDISLQWKDDFASEKRPAAGTVSADEVYERTPENRKRFERAMDALGKKDSKTAISMFREIVSADPKDFIAWTELGSVHFKEEEFKEAEQSYQRALEAKPSFLLALMNMGKLRMAQKQMDSAIEIFTRAVEQHPRSAAANYFLGEAYLQIKKGSKAVGYLYEALRLDPLGHADAHLRLAALYNGAGLKDKAVTEYEQFLKKVPDHPSRQSIEKYIKDNKK